MEKLDTKGKSDSDKIVEEIIDFEREKEEKLLNLIVKILVRKSLSDTYGKEESN